MHNRPVMLPNLAKGDKSGGINLVPRSLVDEAEGEIWPRSGQILISSPHVVFVRRLGDLVSAKKKSEQGEGIVKFSVKQACVGDGNLSVCWMMCLGFR